MNIEFNVEKRFQDYCKRVKLDLNRAHPIQVTEMRRAYFAAAGEMLMFLRDEVGADQVSEDEGVAAMKAAFDQIKSFWDRHAANGPFPGDGE